MIKLRPYQQEVARAVLESVMEGHGRTFSVEIARQGGKNELSAILEVTLLTLFIERGGTLIKASPTFKPQTIISMERLKRRLDGYGFSGLWRSQMGYIVSLGTARAVFLSADGASSVVGHTADILLEMDEAQDIAKDKYTKEFRPMGAATNCTTVLYGTTWDDTTLLEEVKRTNQELERQDGVRRHFSYDWQEVARHNPDYEHYVLAERERLGETHPLFRTQYALLPIEGGGHLLGPAALASVQGNHPRRHIPEPGRSYVAGIDIAGEESGDPETARASRDSTAVCIAAVSTGAEEPSFEVADIYTWTGRKHHEVYPQIVDLLKNVWRCRRLAIDATGMGEPVASFLSRVLGSRVQPFKFTAQSKSELGFNFLAAVNSGRFKLFAGDGSPEHREALCQLEKARADYRPNRTLGFSVDPADGHDDVLMSLALAVEAGRDFGPKRARGGIRHA